MYVGANLVLQIPYSSGRVTGQEQEQQPQRKTKDFHQELDITLPPEVSIKTK